MRSLLIILCISCLSCISIGQENNATITLKSTAKNVVRYNPFGTIIWNTLPLYYERKMNSVVAVSFAAGYIVPHNIKTSKLSFETTNLDGLFSNGIISGHYITPQFKFYLSKKAPNGFYIGRYFKYRKVNVEFDALFTAHDRNTSVDLDANVFLKEYGTGRQFGYQWIIGDRWSIDCFFLGYGYSQYKIGIDAAADISDEEWTAFAQEINAKYTDFVSSIRFGFLKDKLPFDPLNPKVNYAYPFGAVNFRHGISFGFTF